MSRTADDGLTDKQRMFVHEYLIDLNATAAYIRAGYSPKTADSCANRLLGNARIANAIRQVQVKREKKVFIASETVLLELGKIAFADPRKCFDDKGDLLPPREWPDEIAGAISEIVVEEIKEPYTGDVLGHIKKIKFWNKNQALDSLGKHFKLFSDRIEIDVGESLAIKLAEARQRVIEAKRTLLTEGIEEAKVIEANESGIETSK